MDAMSLRVYNTLSGEKEIFQPVQPGRVGIYLCGPTVYKPPHIGHMVGPVVFDAIKRYLRYKGFEVTLVVNITDVDDKLIEAAAAAKRPMREMAEQYTAEYLDCIKRLGVTSIDRVPKASEHMGEIIELCSTLVDRGYAYAAEGNLYFEVSKDADYGKLSHRKVEEQEAGTRKLEAAGKRNPADFALWKAAKPSEPFWDSPWGPGRPGWHIECSAMSMKYLGRTFDMHGGGMDLMFPHHENELAQSESATGQPLARYWLHNGLTRLNTKKMSGSVGNVVSVKSLLDEHGPELLRYMLLSTQYRRPIEFTPEVMSAAAKGLSGFHRLFERLARMKLDIMAPGDNGPDVESAGGDLLNGPAGQFARDVIALKMKFLEMMDDDFNTAGAIGVLHELATGINTMLDKSPDRGPTGPAGEVKPAKSSADASANSVAAAASVRTLRNLGRLLGLFTQSPPPATAAADDGLTAKLMELLIQLRADARKTKNYATADGVRKGLESLGITLEDNPGGTIWRKI
jgi:cysteinyl-tRNA synthetase